MLETGPHFIFYFNGVMLDGNSILLNYVIIINDNTLHINYVKIESCQFGSSNS